MPERLILQGFSRFVDYPHRLFFPGAKTADCLCIHASVICVDFHSFHMVFHRKSLDFACKTPFVWKTDCGVFHA